MDSNKSNALREIKVALIKIEHSTDNEEIYAHIEMLRDSIFRFVSKALTQP